MGCVKSKEDMDPALKYRPDNSNATQVNAHLGHYGPEPTLMGNSPSTKAQNNSYNSNAAALTPFGGTSSVMAPFGGASTSFPSVAVSTPFPNVIPGQFMDLSVSLKSSKHHVWLLMLEYKCIFLVRFQNSKRKTCLFKKLHCLLIKAQIN